MRILLVSSRFPWPPWRGNQLRTAQWVSALSGHECLLMCPPADDGTKDESFEGELRFLPGGGATSLVGVGAAVVSGRPAQEGLYESAAARRLVTEVVRDWRPDVAVIQMVRCGWAADAIRAVDPELPLIFDAIDCMGLHYRRAAAASGWLKRPAYLFEAERCRRREAELAAAAVVTTAVSRRDLQALGVTNQGLVVTVTGGTEAGPADRLTEEPVVLLSGNLGYRPTVRAALWFADRVWPEIRDRIPSARWVLAGARPSPVVRRLGSRKGIEIHADVDDLGVFLHRARVAIAPMASGSGVPIKILEAMAAGVPVVADSWSADGLEDPSAVIVADGASQWTDRLIRLLDDSGAAREQAARGIEAWRAHYAPDRVSAAIRGAVAAAVPRAE